MSTNQHPLVIGYTNWQGEWSLRRIIPTGAPFWGTTKWHPLPGWLLPAHDLDRGEGRLFAMKEFGPPPATCAPAQLERLALLIEESSEVIQAATKILRFGADSTHPATGETGTQGLERELGDLDVAIRLMAACGDVDDAAIDRAADGKAGRIGPQLKHNDASGLTRSRDAGLGARAKATSHG
ncbi:MAG: hypothetical protein J0H82_04355 [Alphaproteobacteria bacterium]|jgi:hypothetical protein|nr:hypothetical protein [Alphaproteobacteria bacterium]